ncbi:MAG: hypothetical protein WBM86_00690, partial [Waterburya sp.]
KQRNKYHAEKIDLEIPNIRGNPKLPRHISGWSSNNHWKLGHQDQTGQIRTVCPINLAARQAEAINLLVTV